MNRVDETEPATFCNFVVLGFLGGYIFLYFTVVTINVSVLYILKEYTINVIFK